MRNELPGFILIFILFMSGGFAYSQSSWDNYKPRTLNEIIKQHSNPEHLKGINKVLTGNMFPSQVKVTYTGMSRKISAARKEHILDWLKTYKANQQLASLFETELLFIENSIEYWLPVQQQVIPYFEKELQKGEQVTLFTTWVGAQKIEDKWDWIST